MLNTINWYVVYFVALKVMKKTSQMFLSFYWLHKYINENTIGKFLFFKVTMKIHKSIFQAIGVSMFILMLQGCDQVVFGAAAEGVHELKKQAKEDEQKRIAEQYTQNYIKKYPQAVPVINRYLDCLKGNVSAVEGCDVHVVQNDEEKVLLANYIKGVNDAKNLVNQ